MSTITRFTVPARTSGRDLTLVRRPRARVDLTALKKAELVAHAEAQGVDSSGTKAEILERLSDE